jgi:uncharacterized protein YbjT (DUF2867 family)
MILLAGATGAAGSHIANEFVRQREPVRILVRNRATAAELAKVPTIELVEGDMSNRSSLGAALDGVDRALMISSSTMDMVDTQCAFVDTAKSAGVRHVINYPAWTLGPIPSSPLAVCTSKWRNTLKRPASPGRNCVRPASCRSICARPRASSMSVHSFWRLAT